MSNRAPGQKPMQSQYQGRTVLGSVFAIPTADISGTSKPTCALLSQSTPSVHRQMAVVVQYDNYVVDRLYTSRLNP
jgi:hypothetical protein